MITKLCERQSPELSPDEFSEAGSTGKIPVILGKDGWVPHVPIEK